MALGGGWYILGKQQAHQPLDLGCGSSAAALGLRIEMELSDVLRFSFPTPPSKVASLHHRHLPPKHTSALFFCFFLLSHCCASVHVRVQVYGRTLLAAAADSLSAPPRLTHFERLWKERGFSSLQRNPPPNYPPPTTTSSSFNVAAASVVTERMERRKKKAGRSSSRQLQHRRLLYQQNL